MLNGALCSRKNSNPEPNLCWDLRVCVCMEIRTWLLFIDINHMLQTQERDYGEATLEVRPSSSEEGEPVCLAKS